MDLCIGCERDQYVQPLGCELPLVVDSMGCYWSPTPPTKPFLFLNNAKLFVGEWDKNEIFI